MKVLLINGSPHERGCTYRALLEVSGELQSQGIETEILHIGKESVGGCIACGSCAKTGKCFVEDSVNEALSKAREVDGFVFGSPVYFASPNGSMIAFMDRFFYAGNFAHKPAAVVASARRAGTTASLDVLMKYPAYMEMPIVNADYWNMVHGNTCEEVEEDLEGLYTMRKTGRNMAWLLKCIASGRASGIEPEKVEKKTWTNFVR